MPTVVGKGDAREGLAPGRVKTRERSPYAVIPWESVLDREVPSFLGPEYPRIAPGCCEQGAGAG